MEIRRVVTGTARDGSATIVSDEIAPRAHEFVHTPGMAHVLLWATEPEDSFAQATSDHSMERNFAPGPGATRFIVVRFPPGSVFGSESFDPEAAGAEQLERTPGLAELFEPDAPGKHTSQTIDYGIVLEGELWLELDNGEETLLKPGDVVIQNATRHSWSVRSEDTATLLTVLVGIDRD
jgi:cupin domain